MAAIILYKELDTDGEGMVGPQNMEEPLWLPLSYTKSLTQMRRAWWDLKIWNSLYGCHLSYTKSLTQMGRSFFPTIGMQAE
jgi:hypothetical protein